MQITYVPLEAKGESIRMKIVIIQCLNVKKWKNIMKEKKSDQ